MLRKGTIESFPVERVLTMAAEDAFTGGVEVHGAVEGTVLLDGGLVVSAVIEDVGLPANLGLAATPGTEELRANVRAVIATLLDVTVGTFEIRELHPITYQIPARHRTRYPVAQLLDDIRSLPARHELRAWSGSLLEIGHSDDSVTLDADMWTLVASMIEPTTIHRVAPELAWDASRIDATLQSLFDLGLVRRRATGTDAGPETDAPAGLVPGPRDTDSVWPTATRPSPPEPVTIDRQLAFAGARAVARAGTDGEDDRKGALGRLIKSLRR